MHVTIRHGSPADASALAELAARTFRDAFAADSTPEDMALHLSQSYGAAQQRRELEDSAISTLLVEVDGALAGFAQVRSGAAPQCVTGESPIELWRFYVDRPWHGQGVAQALMREVHEEARRRGGRTLWLGVFERNERAKAFYRKVGFVDVGAQVFVLGTDPQADRVFACSLEPAS